MIAVAALATLGLAPPPVSPVDDGLVLIARDGGRLRVENRSGKEMWLNPRLDIEWLDGATWKPTVADVYLLAICPETEDPPRTMVILRPDEVREIVSWTGYSCASQCLRACSMNLYSASEFSQRFVVSMALTEHRVPSNPFRMPPRPVAR